MEAAPQDTLACLYTEIFAAECRSACDFLSCRRTQQIRSGGTWLSPASSSLARAHYRGTEDAGKKKQVCALVLLRGGLRAGASLPGSVAQLGRVSPDDWLITPSYG